MNFGAASQKFHIGMGAVAVPGLVAGIFAMHEDLCALPLERLMAPAIDLARNGLPLAPLQSFILDAVGPIFLWSEDSRTTFGSAWEPGKTLRTGEALALPDLADLLSALAQEGANLFYRGDVAKAITTTNERSGAVDLADLAAYRVYRRAPLTRRFGRQEIMGNPAPSSGGPLLAFSLGLMNGQGPTPGFEYLSALNQAMALTDQARAASGLNNGSDDGRVAALLSENFMMDYRARMPVRAAKIQGTTHISVVDGMGNAAALSVSNGEGCGHMLPRLGFMLNNMLGEEDLNPNGFFQWRPNSRITSMMSPTIVRWDDGRILALGSGGSNRIRSAILQVLMNHLCLGKTLGEAVEAPRIHLDKGRMHIEAGMAKT